MALTSSRFIPLTERRNAIVGDVVIDTDGNYRILTPDGWEMMTLHNIEDTLDDLTYNNEREWNNIKDEKFYSFNKDEYDLTIDNNEFILTKKEKTENSTEFLSEKLFRL